MSPKKGPAIDQIRDAAKIAVVPPPAPPLEVGVHYWNSAEQRKHPLDLLEAAGANLSQLEDLRAPSADQGGPNRTLLEPV